jgi:hypothetical protein
MLGKSLQKRRRIHREDILDLARSRADRLADLDATHKSYAPGGETSTMPGAPDGASDLETGRTEQMVIERPDHRQEDRIIFDPLKPMIRKVAPPAGFVSSTEFPTEWTLVQ